MILTPRCSETITFEGPRVSSGRLGIISVSQDSHGALLGSIGSLFGVISMKKSDFVILGGTTAGQKKKASGQKKNPLNRKRTSRS